MGVPRSSDRACDVRGLLACARSQRWRAPCTASLGTMDVPIEASRPVCSVCGKAVRREAVVLVAGAGLLCPLCFTRADITAARRRTGFEGSAVALVGAIAAVIPFAAQAASP